MWLDGVYLTRAQDDNSFSLADDFEDDYILPNIPTNPLNPPMWSVDSSAGQCGNWQKQYTKIHRGGCMWRVCSCYVSVHARVAISLRDFESLSRLCTGIIIRRLYVLIGLHGLLICKRCSTKDHHTTLGL